MEIKETLIQELNGLYRAEHHSRRALLVLFKTCKEGEVKSLVLQAIYQIEEHIFRLQDLFDYIGETSILWGRQGAAGVESDDEIQYQQIAGDASSYHEVLHAMIRAQQSGVNRCMECLQLARSFGYLKISSTLAQNLQEKIDTNHQLSPLRRRTLDFAQHALITSESS